MSTQSFDMNLYDRMTRTYGQEAMNKITKSSVCISGLAGGYGTEVAKNLALSGVKTIYLHDEHMIDDHDIMNSFCFFENHLDQSRSIVLSEYIKELNPYITVYCISNSELYTTVFDTIIVINKYAEQFNEINRYFRTKNVKTIYLNSSGLSGYIFVDVGSNYTVKDLTGESYEPYVVTDIKYDGTVVCPSHQFMNGDLVKFSNVDGNNVEFIKHNTFTVTNTTRTTFTINIEPSDFVFKNGSANYVYKETIINHQSYEEQNKNRTIVGFDWDRSNLIIDILNKLIRLGNVHPWSDEMKKRLEIFLDDSVEMIVRSYGVEIAPVVSIMAGFASTEVMKLIMNKYTPFNQWFTWEDSSFINKDQIPIELKPFGIGSLFGKSFVNDLRKLNVSMVGCGALGCEWLKNLALLNVSTSDTCIKVTDPDHIEKSNLSRQFLFRPKDIGKSKSVSAKNALLNYPSKISAYEEKLTPNNMEFTQSFFNDADIVINALDNMEARKFVDKLCFENGLPLFESGTMGMKGNTQPVIPFVTETYSNSQDQEEEKQFAVCTIKNFPNSIVHTIHWARDYFEIFNRAPNNINNYLTDKNYINTLEGIEKAQAINDINKVYKKNIKSPVDCILWAANIFEKEYNHNIQQLLHCFPKDHMVDDKLFWSNGKRCPTPLTFKNEYAVKFIHATSHLLCRCYGIEDNFDIEDVKSVVETFHISDFEPDTNVKIAKEDSELKNEYSISELLKGTENMSINCVPQDFEKDDDTNWHIEWITSASNCRAIAYGIDPVSNYETKGIAGKIIPAVATTTSTIVGLICLELLKYINGCNKLEDYSSWFVNMADNTTISADPIVAPMINIGDKKINSWTKFKFPKNKTLNQLIEQYKETIGQDIEMVLYDTTIIYSNFLETEMDISLEELFMTSYDINLQTTKVNLILMCEDEDIDIPLVELF